MNAEMLIGIAKPLLKKYSDAPLEDQSKILSELERLAERYMSSVASNIELQPGEDEVLFMLKLQNSQLFWTPCVLDDDDNVTRILVNEYGLNLTQLCRSIPVPKIILLGLALFLESNEESQRTALNDITNIISEAANRPECKLRLTEELLSDSEEETETEISENGKVISLDNSSEKEASSPMELDEPRANDEHEEAVEKHHKKYDEINQESEKMVSETPDEKTE